MSMISAWHLAWAIPLAVYAGMALMAMLAVGGGKR